MSLSNCICPTFNELPLHEQTFSTSTLGIMILFYTTEDCTEERVNLKYAALLQ